jgi:hypothetical protein
MGFGNLSLLVIPAKAGIQCLGLWRLGPGFRRDDGEGLGCSRLLGVTLRNGSGDMSLLLSVYRPQWSLESVVVFAAWLCVFGSKESAVWVLAVGAWL